MEGGKAIKNNAGIDVIEVANKKRHIYLLEKTHKGKHLTKKELEELKEYEEKHQGKKKKGKVKPNKNIVSTIPQLAKEIGCGARTIQNWKSEGMPVRPDKTYDVKAIQKWREERDNRRKPTEVEKTEEQKKKIQLEILSMDLKVRKGELISLEDVEKGRVARVLAVKQELLAVPRAMAKALENMEARQIEALLKSKMNQIVTKFSGQDHV